MTFVEVKFECINCGKIKSTEVRTVNNYSI